MSVLNQIKEENNKSNYDIYHGSCGSWVELWKNKLLSKQKSQLVQLLLGEPKN